MKSKIFFFLMILFVFSCSKESDDYDFELENLIDLSDVDFQACDCAPPGMGSGSSSGSSEDKSKPYPNFEYSSTVKVSIFNRTLSAWLKGEFDWGINLDVNGGIKDVVISNFRVDAKDSFKMSFIGKMYDKNQVIILLRVSVGAGSFNHYGHGSSPKVPKNYETHRLIIKIEDLPSYSSGGTGGGGPSVIPINK